MNPTPAGISQTSYFLEDPLLHLTVLVDSSSDERVDLGNHLLATLRDEAEQIVGNTIHRRINHALLKASQTQTESGASNFIVVWFNGPTAWVARWGTASVQLERGTELHSLFAAEDLEGDSRVRFLPDVVQVEFLTSDTFVLVNQHRVSPPQEVIAPVGAPPNLKVNALRQTELFKDLPFGDLSRLVTASTIQTFEVGTILMTEGSPADSVHIVAEGTVRIERAGAMPVECGFGTCVGERSLVLGERRSATVLCQTAVTTLQIDQKVFRDLLDQDPRFGVRILLQIMKILLRRA